MRIRTAVNEAYSGSIESGNDSYEIDHRVVRKGSGEIRFVHEKCRHVRDEDGRIIRSLGMVLDVTERRYAQESLERSNRELEQFAYVASMICRNPCGRLSGFCSSSRAVTRIKSIKKADTTSRGR